MHPRTAGRKSTRGFAYLALLLAVALMGAGLGGAAQIWHTTMQRERERQLLWIGNQYRRAIRLYWEASPQVALNGANLGPDGLKLGSVTGADGGAIAPQTPPGGLTGSPGDNPAGNGATAADPSDPDAARSAGLAGSAGAGGRTGIGSNSIGGNGIGGNGSAGPGTGGNGNGAPGAARVPSRFPPSLAVLLADPRFQQVRRYLRRAYVDPMTGKADWVPILAPNGGVMGVHSRSAAAPIKQAGFRPDDSGLAGKKHYSEWLFVYSPAQSANAGPNPAGPRPPAAVQPNSGQR